MWRPNTSTAGLPSVTERTGWRSVVAVVAIFGIANAGDATPMPSSNPIGDVDVKAWLAERAAADDAAVRQRAPATRLAAE